MTERELQKLRRVELLEMLLELSKENERLTQEIGTLRAAAEDRRIDLEKAGSIAEASLAMSGVFRAAQDAADLYLASIQTQNAEYEARGQRMLEETQARCQRMLDDAQREIDARWQKLYEQMDTLKISIPSLGQVMWKDDSPEGENLGV